MAANSMADGDLTSRRRGPHPLALAYFGAFAILLLLFGAVAFLGRASDGDPVVTLELHTAASATVEKSGSFRFPRRQESGRRWAPSSAALAQSGAPVSVPASAAPFSNVPAPALPPQIVPGAIVKPVVAGKALIADPALIEQTQQGPLPRIADDGRTPMTAYAPPAPSDKRPRIAIVISGLGISAKATVRRYLRLAGRRDARLRAL
jgi:uncharacterized protein